MRAQFRTLGLAVLGLATIATAVLGYFSAPGARDRCSGAKLGAHLDEFEGRAQTYEGLLAAEDDLRELLSEACDHRRLFGFPQWALGELLPSLPAGEQIPESRVEAVCPAVNTIDATLWERETDQYNRHLLQYRHCDFARFNVLEDDELARLYLPSPEFWAAADELLNSGIEPKIARRVLRSCVFMWDLHYRANPAFGHFDVSEGVLRIDPWRGEPMQLQLDEQDGLSGPATDALNEIRHRRSDPDTLPILLRPDARGKDLRWLRGHEGPLPIDLLATWREPSGLPIGVSLVTEPFEPFIGSGDHVQRVDKPVRVALHVDGFEVRQTTSGTGAVRPWTELDATMRELQSASWVAIQLDPELPAEQFMPQLVALAVSLGPTRMRLAL